ncbi:hypothetical protein CCM_00830 [Cordyceps militaris CM01]|uniref:Uncharacterized protein n=1 Tax=Cordyceps militaris (strain CM01) TaxID=983644 RepID=G3J6E1_CORMM|nr:uncharacterized protein CCM_00830 [Cordyceps militaris CM01]EGX96175.1 hypothetical protein CCM_00830 [Cordyceps militaris CM01]
MVLVCIYLPWSVFPKWAAERGKPAPDDENSTRPPDYDAAAPSFHSDRQATTWLDVTPPRGSGILISGSDQSHAIKALGFLNTTYQLRDGRVAMKFSDKQGLLGGFKN